VHARGPGIAESDARRIFDRFYRAEGARALPGSGLGLSIVRDVVERSGGRVEAAPRAGGGATVGFTLPLATAGFDDGVDEPLDPPVAPSRPPSPTAPPPPASDDEAWAPPVDVRPPTR
jgi:hypothetical protein